MCTTHSKHWRIVNLLATRTLNSGTATIGPRRPAVKRGCSRPRACGDARHNGEARAAVARWLDLRSAACRRPRQWLTLVACPPVRSRATRGARMASGIEMAMPGQARAARGWHFPVASLTTTAAGRRGHRNNEATGATGVVSAAGRDANNGGQPTTAQARRARRGCCNSHAVLE